MREKESLERSLFINRERLSSWERYIQKHWVEEYVEARVFEQDIMD